MGVKIKATFNSKLNDSHAVVTVLNVTKKSLIMTLTVKMTLLFTKLFDSLQTAITASTENRKQAQEQSQEQQRNLINLQHDLSQVRRK